MNATNILYTFEDLMNEGIFVEDKEQHQPMRKVINKLLIPMIQRPYAQGRRSQTSIRNKFLKDIFNVLTDKSKDLLELNFIYGTFITIEGNENIFELLDGQQRMTTLFLIYWYFANQEHIKDETYKLPEYLSKFEYQTRTTSTDFLSRLLQFWLPVDTAPSKSIRSAVWYSKSFDKDTTVDAMIRMLDSIDTFYKRAMPAPIFKDLDKIKFYVLELNGFGLTEELFIKMNARGLQLTPFENFKADLVGYMKKDKTYGEKRLSSLSLMKREVEYWLDFSSLIDGKWVDLFWMKPEGYEDSGSKQSDICFFRFVQRFFANKAIVLADKKVREDELVQFFIQNIEVERHQGFDKYASLIKKGKDKSIDIIKQLEQVLNFLMDREKGKLILETLTAPWERERKWQPWGTVGNQASDVGQRQMIILSAMVEYINEVGDIKDFCIDKFRIWMRFIHIMVQGTDINGVDAQITLTRLLRDILNYRFDDDEVICAFEHPRKAIIDYSRSHRENRYLNAEALKASLVLQYSAWERAFTQAEENPFMQGSCMFYYKEGMDVEDYKLRTANLPLVFDENGVTEQFAKDFLLIKGVLCRNYDWTGYRKSTYNFTVTNSSAQRYLRNLTIWNDFYEVRDFFYELLKYDNPKQMTDYIESVVSENHELILKQDSWTEEEKQRLQKTYNRFYQESEMKAMKWLQNTGIKAIGCYFNNDANVSLYKGPVNCMFLSLERHDYSSKILSHFKDTLDFQFADERQKVNYDLYGNYSGDTVILRSHIEKLSDGCQIMLVFHTNDSVSMLVNDEKKAKQIFKAYLAHYDVSNIKDYSGKDIQDEEGNLSSHFDNSKLYYRVNHIVDADKQCIDEIINSIQLACEIIQIKDNS